jgi:hypothetical protein
MVRSGDHAPPRPLLHAQFGTGRHFAACSLATAKQQDAKLWELRTATDLADMLRGQGNRAEACEVLRPVCEWFSEGKDMADYIAARALLARIEGRHSHTDECVC